MVAFSHPPVLSCVSPALAARRAIFALFDGGERALLVRLFHYAYLSRK